MTATSKTAPARAPLHFLGLACAIGVSTIYFNQPLLVEMSHTYKATAWQVGFVTGATQVGYALGLLLFVPLGDVLERRSLMMRMYGAVIVALLLVAMAPTLAWLIAGSVVLGLLASVTHIVLPIAPDLVTDKERGRAIGTVMMGLLLGILLARSFAGWVSRIPALLLRSSGGSAPAFLHEIAGWRYVFVIAALVNAAFLPLLGRVMPRLPPKQNLHYRDAMLSLWTLVKTQPLLRESCLIGALIFASFQCFWTTLTFLLDSHYGLGAGVAGSFGVVGAAGAMVAPIAGRLADKRGTRWVLTAGMTAARDLLCAAMGRGKVRPLVRPAHCCSGGRRDPAGHGRATGAGGQPDAHLRPCALGAQPAQYRLHDRLLLRCSHRDRALHRGVGALEVEWRLRPGSGANRSWRRAPRIRIARAGDA